MESHVAVGLLSQTGSESPEAKAWFGRGRVMRIESSGGPLRSDFNKASS